MPRRPRFNIPGQPQHVIQRGNNRQNIFREESDYLYYLEKITEASEKHQCKIHAYVLMTNHVHLLVTPETEEGLGKMMQMIGRYYVQYFNKKYKRTGTLWEGRYKASLIDTNSYLLICMRYIELNPVRAKNMVDRPSDYVWSSYSSNALGKQNSLITPHLLYKRLGNDRNERAKAYSSLFCLVIPEKTLDEMREATNKAWVLGSARFKNNLSKKLGRPVESKGHGGDRKSGNYQETNRPV